jgi:hypothetical protein
LFGKCDVELARFKLDLRVAKIAAARANDDVYPNVEPLARELNHARAGCAAALQQIGAQFDAIRAALLRRDRRFNGIYAGFEKDSMGH